MDKYIAFDVGGTRVKHAVLLKDGTFLEKSDYPTDKSTLESFVTDMLLVIKSYQKEHEITGIAISMPGFIDVETGYSETAGAITVLNGKNLKEIVEENCSIPTEMENDGNCVALAEKFNGNASHCNSFVCITIGTGIGGGLYLNNKIHHGYTFRGGEIGYMVTLGDQPGQQTWNENGATSSLINSYKAYKGINPSEPVEGFDVFAEAEYNPEVSDIVEKWLERTSYGILNLVATLNPEKVLIGGGISGREDLINRIEDKLEKIKWWHFIKVPINVCKHKNDAGMLGALHHFLAKNQQEIKV
ncbi:ROK family protein [Sediminibacillus massiliensis]|uniref:ROK family protein n=1 Tax=Sediminibacillus massiliensis TaxID=1926277 RepID=UPI0015C3AF88|nr:ROK family protein [Sediminibacillus massiliensis]